MRIFLALSTLAALVALVPACGGAAAQTTNEATAPAADEGTAVAAPPAEAVCPVSGEHFHPTADSPKAEYKGQTVYFCCPGCVKKFAADPEKYMNKPVAAAHEGEATPAPAAAHEGEAAPAPAAAPAAAGK